MGPFSRNVLRLLTSHRRWCRHFISRAKVGGRGEKNKKPGLRRTWKGCPVPRKRTHDEQGIRCPECGSTALRVRRTQRAAGFILRRVVCSCGTAQTTVERPVRSPPPDGGAIDSALRGKATALFVELQQFLADIASATQADPHNPPHHSPTAHTPEGTESCPLP